jgi:hypothetical protein
MLDSHGVEISHPDKSSVFDLVKVGQVTQGSGKREKGKGLRSD